jgi:hypothetical protein
VVHMSREQNTALRRCIDAMLHNATNWIHWKHIANASGLSDGAAWVCIEDLCSPQFGVAIRMGPYKETCLVKFKYAEYMRKRMIIDKQAATLDPGRNTLTGELCFDAWQ